MAREDLISIGDRTTEEQQKICSAGGRASGAARRRKRALKDAVDLFLSLPVADTRTFNELTQKGVDPGDIDNQMAMVCGLHARACAGDAKAGKLILEMLGENTKDDPMEDQLMKAKELLGGIDGVIE